MLWVNTTSRYYNMSLVLSFQIFHQLFRKPKNLHKGKARNRPTTKKQRTISIRIYTASMKNPILFVLWITKAINYLLTNFSCIQHIFQLISSTKSWSREWQRGEPLRQLRGKTAAEFHPATAKRGRTFKRRYGIITGQQRTIECSQQL